MPYLKFRLSALALMLLTGCAAPNFFAASSGGKANAEPVAARGPRASAFTNSWSGTQHADRAPQAAAAVAAGGSERRIQELLAAGERSQSTGDRVAARAAFEQVLRLAPGDAYANYQLAKLDDDDGRFADAERHYFTVMKQTPNDPDILSSLGWSYLLQGRFNDSDRVLREALRYDPNHQFALYNLGWLYGTRGDYDGALTIFRSAGSEADAQQALALLRQNAGAVPVAGERYASAPLTAAMPAAENTASNAAGTLVDSRGGTETAEPVYANPQARKFAEDYKRLKAENQKQQQDRRSRLAQNSISAPSPWNNNRRVAGNAGQRDSGQLRAAGQMETVPPVGAFRGGSADPVQINGRYPESNAAFPGAAPSQANRARLAGPADFGPAVAAVPAGTAPVLTPGVQPIPGAQAIYEQPAATPGQSRSPIITPAGETATSPGSNAPTWNSLPPDNSYRGNSNSGPLPANRVPEWPRPGAVPSSTDRDSTGQAAAPGQFNAAPPRGRNPRQDAQTTAAQLGLSAGSGGLGFPASEWPSSPPSSNGPGSNLPQWPGRPLSGGSVPQAIVPSAQGVVYGSNADSGVPNFNSGKPTAPPARQP